MTDEWQFRIVDQWNVGWMKSRYGGLDRQVMPVCLQVVVDFAQGKGFEMA